MKNNTIEILAEGENHIPVGAVVTRIENGIVQEVYKAITDEIIYITPTTKYIYQVDFKDVDPLYPHKGMEVPEGGIEFTDGGGIVRDIGEYGFIWCDDFVENEYVVYSESEHKDFKLKRTLPKTLTVCKYCHKELCECMHEEGWYRVKCELRWALMYWGGSIFRTCKIKTDAGNDYWTIDSLEKIDWSHPINVIPESER